MGKVHSTLLERFVKETKCMLKANKIQPETAESLTPKSIEKE